MKGGAGGWQATVAACQAFSVPEHCASGYQTVQGAFSIMRAMGGLWCEWSMCQGSRRLALLPVPSAVQAGLFTKLTLFSHLRSLALTVSDYFGFLRPRWLSSSTAPHALLLSCPGWEASGLLFSAALPGKWLDIEVSTLSAQNSSTNGLPSSSRLKGRPSRSMAERWSMPMAW